MTSRSISSGQKIKNSYWDESECLHYHGMLSLHEMFERVGAELTKTDIDVLYFLLNEGHTAAHPLDPESWTVKPDENNPDDPVVSPSPQLLKAWRRIKPRTSGLPLVDSKPKSGFELLLELEKKKFISDGKLEPLLKLLRVLTRHDLLPLVSHKRRRTVSEERIEARLEMDNLNTSLGMPHTCQQAEMSFPYFTEQLTTDFSSPVWESSTRRRRKRRGNGWSRKPKKMAKQTQLLPPLPVPHKVSCDIRLRVRAEYLEHEAALREGVSSDKRQPLERQFDLFSRANSLLRARDLGSIVCDIKFTELENLEAFWGDYLSGALLEALKGVFITDSLRMAAGSEGVRLLISVDQDDYEVGRRLLRAKKMMSGCHSGRDAMYLS